MTVIPEELFTALRGSAGDKSASRNASTQYVYPRAAPTDPNSIRQQGVRFGFGVISTRWRTDLTDAKRAGWRQYAAHTPLGTTLKAPRYVDGRSHFMRCSVIRRRAAVPIITTPPTAYGLPPFLPMAFKVAAGDTFIGVTWDNSDTWAQESGALAWISTTAQYTRFVNAFQPPYAFRGLISAAATPPITLPLGYTATLASRIFVKAQIQRADARLSSPQAARVIVIPP